MRYENHAEMDFLVRTLGAQEARIILSMEAKGLSVIDVDAATLIVGSRAAASRALLRLHRKGWLERSARGRYMLHASNTGHLAVRVASPLKFASSVCNGAYVGWWAAARHHGLTWQFPMLVRLAATRQVKARIYEEFTIEFVKLTPEKFFGYEYSRIDGFNVSTVSKTAADCVDRPAYAGGIAETGIVVGTACDRIGVGPVIDDVVRMGSKSSMQRLGFLIDCTVPHLFHSDERARLLSAIGSPSRFVIGAPKVSPGDFGYVSEWGVQVNMSKDLFLYEMDRFGRRS